VLGLYRVRDQVCTQGDVNAAHAGAGQAQACPNPLAFQRDTEALFRTSCDIMSPQGINVDLVRSRLNTHRSRAGAFASSSRCAPSACFYKCIHPEAGPLDPNSLLSTCSWQSHAVVLRWRLVADMLQQPLDLRHAGQPERAPDMHLPRRCSRPCCSWRASTR